MTRERDSDADREGGNGGLRELRRNAAYWDRAAPEARFSHPLDRQAWAREAGPGTRVLDAGCGYGRVLAQLAELGLRSPVGVDASTGMLARARESCPRAQLACGSLTALPFAAASFDAVLLFAVLTCIPDDGDQRRVIAELHRLLVPGGRLFLSELPLQDDPRNRERYAAEEERHGTYGVFDSGDGTIFRHHDPAWLAALTVDFELVSERRVATETMRGNPVEVLQRELRRLPAEPLV